MIIAPSGRAASGSNTVAAVSSPGSGLAPRTITLVSREGEASRGVAGAAVTGTLVDATGAEPATPGA